MSLTPRPLSSVRICSQNARPFLLPEPQPQQFFASLYIHTHGDIQSFGEDLAFIAHFQKQSIQIDDGPDRRQRTLPPFFDACADTLADRRDEFGRNFNGIFGVQKALDVARNQAVRIQAQNGFIKPVPAPLMFADQLRGEFAASVVRHLSQSRKVWGSLVKSGKVKKRAFREGG